MKNTFEVSKNTKRYIFDVLQNQLDGYSNFDVDINRESFHDIKYILNSEIGVDGVKLERDKPIRFFDSKIDIDWEKAELDIFQSLNFDSLKIGEISEMEVIIKKIISLSSQTETLSWINNAFLKYNPNALFICTLLHTLSHMEYDEVIPNGPTMAMASLSHEDERVVGYAIKAFENWNSKTTLTFMKSTKPRSIWAFKEWQRVQEYIGEFGDEEDELFNQNDQSYEGMDTTTR